MSSANTLLGNGVCTYIVSPTTSGDPSWPRSTPVENIQAPCSLPTFWALICVSLLYRWLYMSPACIAQFLGSAVSFSTSGFAHTAAGTNGNHANAKRTHGLLTIVI